MRIRSLALAALLAAPLTAAEIQVSDLRLGLGVSPIPTETEETTTFADGSSEDGTSTLEGSHGVRLGIGYQGGHLAPVGGLFGVELVSLSGTHTYDSYTTGGTTYSRDDLEAIYGKELPELSFSAVGVNIDGGLGLALTDSLHIEVVGVLGAGAVTHEVLAEDAGGSLTTTDASGAYWNAGIRAGAYAAASNLIVGAVVEYLHSAMVTSADFSDGSSTDYEAAWNGVGARLELGIRF